MQQRYLLSLLAGLSMHFSFAQHRNTPIDYNGDPEETSVFINPKNPQSIVAGANPCFAYHSDDGGHSWAREKLTSQFGNWCDPCIIADTAGNFYYFHLANPTHGVGNFVDRIVCQKSTDEGKTWSLGTYTGLNGRRVQDKPWATVNPKTNELYVTWTQFDHYRSPEPLDSSIIFISKSINDGQTWSTPSRVSKIAGDATDGFASAEGAVPAIGPNGEVYVTWARNDTVWFNQSADDGETWQNVEIAVVKQPGGWDFNIPGIYRCNGLPIVRCDLSRSARRGTIYVNWSDQRNGNHDTDIWLAKSNDGGKTWSQPLRVNDDSAGHQQFFCWMDIDQSNGNLYFIFYDRRNYSDLNTDVYVASSADGGNTFINKKISEQPFNPRKSIFFGDYINISACKGKIVPIWTRMDSDKTSIWTASLDYPVLVESPVSKRNDHYVLSKNSTNLFAATTEIDVEINEPGYYSMTLYDEHGKEAATIFSDDYLQTGMHSIIVNTDYHHLTADSYYYELQHGDEFETRKQVVMRNKP